MPALYTLDMRAQERGPKAPHLMVALPAPSERRYDDGVAATPPALAPVGVSIPHERPCVRAWRQQISPVRAARNKRTLVKSLPFERGAGSLHAALQTSQQADAPSGTTHGAPYGAVRRPVSPERPSNQARTRAAPAEHRTRRDTLAASRRAPPHVKRREGVRTRAPHPLAYQ